IEQIEVVNEWNSDNRVVDQIGIRIGVEDAVARANYRSLRAERIPGDSDPRSEIKFRRGRHRLRQAEAVREFNAVSEKLQQLRCERLRVLWNARWNDDLARLEIESAPGIENAIKERINLVS